MWGIYLVENFNDEFYLKENNTVQGDEFGYFRIVETNSCRTRSRNFVDFAIFLMNQEGL